MNHKFKCLTLVLIFTFISVDAYSQLGSSKIRLNGYSSFEFEKQFGDEGKGDPNGSFDSDLFDLVLNVNMTDRFRISADLTWEHGTATEDGFGNAAVEYAFGEYMINPLLKIRAGKMFTYFGIYNEIHTAKPAFLTVKEPLSTNKNNKFGSGDEGRFYPRWLTGVSVLGNRRIGELNFDYILQISNGVQEDGNMYEEDDNKEKAFNGRIRIETPQELRLGLSFYKDKMTEFDSEGEDSGNRSSLLSLGGQAEYMINNIGFEVEYVWGNFEYSNSNKISRNAYTAMVYYIIDDLYTPYLRMESLDPDADKDKDKASMLVYGVNIQIDDGLYFKIELNNINSDDLNKRFKGKNYSELKAAIAIGF